MDIGQYRRDLIPSLPPEIFTPNPGRLVWFASCALIALGGYYAIVFLDLPWYLKLLYAIAIGVANGTQSYIFHETLHGTVTKNQFLQSFVGFFSLLPYLIAPTYWTNAHNKYHHGQTQSRRDPDVFPTLMVYNGSQFVRRFFPYTPGSGHLRSVTFFFFGFTFLNFVGQVKNRFRAAGLESNELRRAKIELAAQVTIMVLLLVVAGPANWLYVCVIPFAIQNYRITSYVATNHYLSPLTKENDPLENTLTVTSHPLLEWFSLNVGYHVEHHLFPMVSPKHAKVIRRELEARYPNRYKSMPKWEAMRRLYKTSRIYKNSHQLVNPETFEIYDTI